MTISQNPANTRLKYIWQKQKPQVHPLVMIDLLSAVANRLGITEWADRVEGAAHKADREFEQAFAKWRHGNTSEVDAPFVDAAVAISIEMPEFKKTSPVDGLIQWFARQLNGLLTQMADPESHDFPHVYKREYDKVLDLLRADPVLVEWFTKKKPNLLKLDTDDVFEEVRKFEEDREPEVVYEGKDKAWAGWDVVKLMTKTQIQHVGEVLDNCMKEGSSYTEGYCEQARTGKSQFFALRQDGEPILSVQWSPGLKEPEQVLGHENDEPEDEANEKIDEWIESRGGTRRRWSELSDSQREIAEYIDEHDSSHDDDGAIAYNAMEWDSAFSVNNATKWIDTVGAYAVDLARLLDNERLDADDFGALPGPVRHYIFDHYDDSRFDGKLKEIISLGLLANEMLAVQKARTMNAPKSKWSPKQIGFGHKGHEGFGRDEWASEDRTRREATANAEIAKDLLGGLLLSGQYVDELATFLVEAKKWLDAGWSDHTYFDDAAQWWAQWFAPDEAAIYFFDLSNETNREKGVSLEVAKQLRDRGITAQEVLDAERVMPTVLNVSSADAIAAAVAENRRLYANKRRRTSQRPARQRPARRGLPIWSKR